MNKPICLPYFQQKASYFLSVVWKGGNSSVFLYPEWFNRFIFKLCCESEKMEVKLQMSNFEFEAITLSRYN